MPLNELASAPPAFRVAGEAQVARPICFTFKSYHHASSPYANNKRGGKAMPQFAVIDAPSLLGLSPSGVETLPEALKNAGLIQLTSEYAGQWMSQLYQSTRDKSTLLLNPHSIKEVFLRLAEKVAEVRRKGHFPCGARGDCRFSLADMASAAAG
jgi:arginase family enzyme